MKFSVVVISYNSNIDKMLFTLKSIVEQKFDGYEIVIADDASKENNFSLIENYFKENDFNDYVMVANDTNKGTVKNILTGLNVAKGKYIKVIGTGDALYGENTLQQVYDFMESGQRKGCFGLLRGFKQNVNGQIQTVPYYHPFDIQAYRGKININRIQKNLTLYSDNVCGAAICCEKIFLMEYLKKIEDYVVYEEDIFQVLCAVENQPLELFDEYMIWYEIGEGISTKKRSGFAKLLEVDVEKFYGMLYNFHSDNKFVRKRNFLKGFYKIKNLYLRTLLRFFVNPDAIRYLISSGIQRKQKRHTIKKCNKGFFDI